VVDLVEAQQHQHLDFQRKVVLLELQLELVLELQAKLGMVEVYKGFFLV
jgi:hypothetical protein